MISAQTLQNKSKGIVAFYPTGEVGKRLAIFDRETNPILRHSRLSSCIQAYPDRIKWGVVYRDGVGLSRIRLPQMTKNHLMVWGAR